MNQLSNTEKYTTTNFFRIVYSGIAVFVSHYYLVNLLYLSFSWIHIGFSLFWFLIIQLEYLIERNHVWTGYIPLFLDLALVTYLVSITGFNSSPMILGYYGIVTLSSLTIERNYGMFATSLSILFMLFLLILLKLGLLSNYNIITSRPAEYSNSGYLIFLFCYSIALMVIHLTVSNIVQSEKKEKMRAQEALDQLKDSQDALSRMERENTMNQMVSHLAHEINNPLNFISTGEIISRDGLDRAKTFALGAIPDSEETISFRNELESRFTEIKEGLDQSKLGLRRIADTISEIRAITRVDGLQLSQFDIYKVLLNNIEIVLERNQISKDQFSIFVQGNPFPSIPNEEISILSQKHILERAFKTLMSNSIHFASKAKSPEIRIEIHKIIISKSKLYTIAIRNNGPPIEEEKLGTIFDMKSQSSKGVELIGLPIVKELLKSIQCNLSLTDNGKKSGWVEFQMVLKSFQG